MGDSWGLLGVQIQWYRFASSVTIIEAKVLSVLTSDKGDCNVDDIDLIQSVCHLHLRKTLRSYLPLSCVPAIIPNAKHP